MTTRVVDDDRIVMTLDAGGTNFVCSAMQGGEAMVESVNLPAKEDDLEASLSNIVDGFTQIKDQLSTAPMAISFAFPGPADYQRGIIGDLGNLPAYRGGVALGPMLEELFGVPVLINNDGDLFAYGQFVGGYLKHLNTMLEKAGSPKRYRNLLGITLGTGIGAGIVQNGQLYRGDNSAAGEIWLIRDKLNNKWNVEEHASIRAVQRLYTERAEKHQDQAPTPKQIAQIANGDREGDRRAARDAFCMLGEAVGEALAEAVTLLDAIVVIGGGLSAAYPLFLQTIVNELNGYFETPAVDQLNRLVMNAYNLEDPVQLDKFKNGRVQEVIVPRTGQRVTYDSEKRMGVGVSKMDTSRAISLGAYSIALRSLN